MSVNFYLHTPLPPDGNERRAIYQVARLLHHRYQHRPDPFTLVANISPDLNLRLQNRVTQLDAFLLAPNFLALLEFKHYFDPIIAKHLTGKWQAKGKHRSRLVSGGNQRNPFSTGQTSATKMGDIFKRGVGF